MSEATSTTPSVIEDFSPVDTEYKNLKCSQFFDKWRQCSSVHFQFHHFYNYGEFKDCLVYKDDLLSCLAYKTTKSNKSKEGLQKALTRDVPKFTTYTVWEKRENPQEFWNKE